MAALTHVASIRNVGGGAFSSVGEVMLFSIAFTAKYHHIGDNNVVPFLHS